MLNRDLNTKTCACGLPGESQLVEQGNPPVLGTDLRVRQKTRV